METLQTGQYNEMNENESYQKENPPNFRRHKKEEILLSQWKKKKRKNYKSTKNLQGHQITNIKHFRKGVDRDRQKNSIIDQGLFRSETKVENY